MAYSFPVSTFSLVYLPSSNGTNVSQIGTNEEVLSKILAVPQKENLFFKKDNRDYKTHLGIILKYSK